ncbi:MAG: tetratricopeptide repeat protein [Actinobacteria bacterium]|nr:tetratricopeptide repeat protein [Actinomycetota bacterium]
MNVENGAALGALPPSAMTAYFPRMLLEWPASEGPSYREMDGSLVFVDISGFTKMSERLAEKGKVGAEEVTEIMSSTFTRLLAVAYENGGSLLKFGGDALLVFYRGEGHAARAVYAAAGMRRKLAEIGKGLKSSAGNVTLRMSVGVHTGIFHFFLVGELHRELIVAGPAASKTVEMESTAEAGEILLSPAMAATVDPSLLGREKGGGVLLARMPPAPKVDAREPAPASQVDPAQFIPPAIRERLAEGPLEPEHRQVTIAFVHFDGSDELVQKAGCSEVTQQLHELVRTAQRAAAEHDVTFLATDVDHDGGKIILAAGTPVGTGHDEEQMLRAVRAIMDAKPAISIRIGVNRGHVFAGDVGPYYRRTYTIMGDAVNLAARVMARAETGQILSTPSVLDRSRTLFDTRELAAFAVKGKAHPVTAFAVGSICGSRQSKDAQHLPLLGRETELEVLLDALDEAKRGTGGLCEIVGDAGIGKSRLLEELLANAGDARVVHVVAEQYESSTPYFAFRRLLRSVLGLAQNASREEAGRRLAETVERTAPDLSPWLPLLALPVDAGVPQTREASGLDEKFKRERLHRSVATLLERAIDGPALIAIEDAHWLDEASNELLRSLVLGLPARWWLVCVTSRLEGRTLLLPSDRKSTILVLSPLPGGAAAALVKEASRGLDLAAHELAALAARGGGHPLFLQELVSESRAGGSVESLPDTVEAVITTRLDRLEPADRTLLRYAAVIGAQFSLELLNSVASDRFPDVVERASWNRLAEFLEPNGPNTFRFRHMLFRDVAYEALPFGRRREIHDRIGSALERESGEEVAEILSLHFHKAQRFDKSWQYSVVAGDRAHAKFANVQAVEFYRRALDSARRLLGISPVDVAGVHERLGDVSTQAAMYAQASEAYRNARKLTALESDLPRLLRKEGVVCRLSGQYSRALTWFSRGLKKAGVDADHERVELLIAYAGVLFHQGRYRKCIAMCERALPQARRLNLRSALAHIYYLVHTAYTWLGDERRADYRDLALPIYEELGDLLGQANTLINLGVDAYFAGEWDHALDVNSRAKEVLEQIGDVIGVADALNNIGEILSDQGRLDDAQATFAESLASYRAARSPYGIALSEINLGRAAARAGRQDEAQALLESALARFTEIKAESWIAEARARIAEAYVLAARPDDALSIIEETLVATERIRGMPALQAMLHRARGYALLQVGDRAAAAASLEESLRIGTAAKAQYEMALTHQALALLRGPASGPGKQSRAEAARILARLGVERAPQVPLPESRNSFDSFSPVGDPT